MQDEGLELKLEPGTSSSAVDSKVKTFNGSQREEGADVRSVLIVGAGPAGLMLAYV